MPERLRSIIQMSHESDKRNPLVVVSLNWPSCCVTLTRCSPYAKKILLYKEQHNKPNFLLSEEWLSDFYNKTYQRISFNVSQNLIKIFKWKPITITAKQLPEYRCSTTHTFSLKIINRILSTLTAYLQTPNHRHMHVHSNLSRDPLPFHGSDCDRDRHLQRA